MTGSRSVSRSQINKSAHAIMWLYTSCKPHKNRQVSFKAIYTQYVKSVITTSFKIYLVPLFQNESSCKTFHMKINLIHMKINLYGTHFHMNGFARRLVLTQRQKATRSEMVYYDLGLITHYLLRACIRQWGPNCFV